MESDEFRGDAVGAVGAPRPEDLQVAVIRDMESFPLELDMGLLKWPAGAHAHRRR